MKFSDIAPLLEGVVPKGTVKFINTQINEPFVQDILQDYANEHKMGINEVNSKFQEEIKKTLEYFKETPLMNEQAIEGVVEQVLFNYIPKDKPEVTYKVLMENLKEMFLRIQAVNKHLFPMRDGSDGRIVEPIIHVTPAPPFIKQADWLKSVKTAAASAQGDIVFYLPFANDLIYYAEKKGIKAVGTMYQSNGGPIPDNYAYIEFLILHELYHVIHGDTKYYSEALAKYICKNADKYPKLLRKFGWNGKD